MRRMNSWQASCIQLEGLWVIGEPLHVVQRQRVKRPKNQMLADNIRDMHKPTNSETTHD